MKFNDTDRVILNSYIGVIDGLSHYLGSAYEIVLHSLEDLDHSVIAIINGQYTGRKVGYPITNLALKMLTEIEQKDVGDYITYSSINKAGEPLKSATLAIRGERNRVIGLMCINMYLNSPLYSVIGELVSPDSRSTPSAKESYAENSTEVILSSLRRVRANVSYDQSVTARAKNKKIIEELYAEGIFNLKNAVNIISEEIGLSKNTVYLHLRELEKKHADE